MHRQHIHFASEPKHIRADDWACVLLQVRRGAYVAQQLGRGGCVQEFKAHHRCDGVGRGTVGGGGLTLVL